MVPATGIFSLPFCDRCPLRVYSLPFCDRCPLRVYSLSPSAIGARCGYILSRRVPPGTYTYPLKRLRGDVRTVAVTGAGPVKNKVILLTLTTYN
eukprot:1178256-Prorocentrum_minimum.AAC.3